MSGPSTFDVAPKTLWTPDRDVRLDQSSQHVETIFPAEMRILEAMHTIAQRHGIVLACERCRRPFHGLNSTTAQAQAVGCGCRELRATVRQSRIIGV